MRVPPQAIFTIFFAIFWGISANAWPKWKAFNVTPALDERRVRWRIAWSVSMLNFAPAIFFAVVLLQLEHHTFDKLTGAAIAAAIIPAFAIFGFYHLWIAGIEYRAECFYFHEAELKPELMKKKMVNDPSIEDLFLADDRWRFHAVVAASYVLLSFVGMEFFLYLS